MEHTVRHTSPGKPAYGPLLAAPQSLVTIENPKGKLERPEPILMVVECKISARFTERSRFKVTNFQL
jgi:hypothetical protein